MENRKSVVKKYRYGLPSLPNIVSNNHYRILCKVYNVRFRLPKLKKNCCTHKSMLIQKTSPSAITMYTKLQSQIENALHEARQKIIDSKGECPICYGEFNHGEMAPWFVSCMHAYCFNCLKTITKYSNTCSLCREPIYSEYDYKISRLTLREYEWAIQTVESERAANNEVMNEPENNESTNELVNDVEPEIFIIMDIDYDKNRNLYDFLIKHKHLILCAILLLLEAITIYFIPEHIRRKL